MPIRWRSLFLYFHDFQSFYVYIFLIGLKCLPQRAYLYGPFQHLPGLITLILKNPRRYSRWGVINPGTRLCRRIRFLVIDRWDPRFGVTALGATPFKQNNTNSFQYFQRFPICFNMFYMVQFLSIYSRIFPYVAIIYIYIFLLVIQILIDV